MSRTPLYQDRYPGVAAHVALSMDMEASAYRKAQYDRWGQHSYCERCICWDCKAERERRSKNAQLEN